NGNRAHGAAMPAQFLRKGQWTYDKRRNEESSGDEPPAPDSHKGSVICADACPGRGIGLVDRLLNGLEEIGRCNRSHDGRNDCNHEHAHCLPPNKRWTYAVPAL